MEIRRYWALTRKWLWLILAGILVAGGIAYFLTQRAEGTYRATAILLVQGSSDVGLYPSQYGVSTLTYAELITQPSVMYEVLRVNSDLELPYTAESLRRIIDVETNTNTNLIKLSVRHTSPNTAKTLANSTAEIFLSWYQGSLIDEATRSLTTIGSQIAELEAKTVRTDEEETKLEQLQSLQTIWITELGRAMASNAVTIAELASYPTMPIDRHIWLNVAIACILGLAVTTAGVSVVEYLDRSVKTTEDIGRLTGLPVLGAVVHFKKDKKREGYLASEVHPPGAVTEAFRMVRTNLQFVGLDKPAQTILMTSPGIGEGKSTVAANLGVAIAQTGKRVVVVDADLRHPSLHRFFKLPNTRGFSNVLLMGDVLKVSDILRLTNRPQVQQIDLTAVLQPTEFEGLRVLTAGSPVPNPAELLGSARVDIVRDQLKREADTVIFDCAPMLVAADAVTLAAKLDAAIMVVRAGQTTTEALSDAKEALSRGNNNILGVVFNGVKASGRGHYYYYYYRSHYAEEKIEERKEWEPHPAAASAEFATRVRERLTGVAGQKESRQGSTISRFFGRFRREPVPPPKTVRSKRGQRMAQPQPSQPPSSAIGRFFSSIRDRSRR
jgi:Mrp family chromosome partitioning ATPase/capsular polysaccharide biosynthesis protein